MSEQILKNQQVILLALKKLLPDETIYGVDGLRTVQRDQFLEEAIDVCVENTNALLSDARICCAWCGTETTVGAAKIEKNLLWCEPCDTWQEYEGVE